MIALKNSLTHTCKIKLKHTNHHYMTSKNVKKNDSVCHEVQFKNHAYMKKITSRIKNKKKLT